RLFLDCALFLQDRERREGMAPLIGRCLRSLESRAKLARIRIDPNDQELGRERAEIDSSIDQWLALVGCLRHYDLAIRSKPGDIGSRYEFHVDCFVDLVDHRLERDDAGLPHRRTHCATDAQPFSPAPAKIE